MKSFSLVKAAALTLMVLAVSFNATAQNKDIDKGKETLKKALEQTDAYKKQDMINKAKEMFAKGGLKPQEINVILGDAYLEKGDLVNATNSYNTATKEEKKIGLKKVAEAYVDQAFSGEDEKNMAKSLKKAMDLFGKAGEPKEGARMIGDRYFEQGEKSYPKALEYYLIGEANVKIEQIANSYFEKGGDNEVKAAETYLRLKTREGYKKAGDIYYNRNEFQKAIDAYLAGGIGEGIKKYAEFLYSEHRDEEADNLMLKLADAFSEKKDDEALEALAAETQKKGSYALAAKLYDKAGSVSKGDVCRAYDALIGFRLEEAKSLFAQAADPSVQAMAKLITDNQKFLNPLADLADNMEDLKKNAPFVNLITDSVTGKSVPSPSDQKLQEDYYKSILQQIIKNVNDIAANYAKLTDPTLKKFVKQRFLQYGAVRNILDKETFVVKKQKQDIKVKDVIL
jgi:tetratricopeptide (TPR) repeat protein